MAKKASRNSASDIDAKPTPPALRRRRLQIRTLDAVRRHMVGRYNDARAGVLSISDAKGLIYVLTCIAAVIRDGELEQRLADIEARLDNAPTSSASTTAPARGPNYDDDED